MNVKRESYGRLDEPCSWCKRKFKKMVLHVTYFTGCLLGEHKLCKKCEELFEDNGHKMADPAIPQKSPIGNSTAMAGTK